MQVIEDTNKMKLLLVFGGAIDKDIIDEAWGAIAKGLKFTVIGLA